MEATDGMRNARDRGVLWKLEYKGVTSWLYGTIHVGRAHWVYPGPALVRALASVQTLALEMDITDPATVRALRDLPPGTKTPLLSAQTQQRIRVQVERQCLSRGALSTMHPVMQVGLLAAMAQRSDGLDPAWAQENMLAGFAKGMGLKVVALETPQQQMLALIPRDPNESLEIVEDTLKRLEDGRVRKELNHIVQAWEHGDLDDLAAYEKWCDCLNTPTDRANLRRILDDRNPQMADGIAALAMKGPVLAAVGALHMTGQQALPQLLERRGIKVTRVPLSISGTGTAQTAP